MLRDDIFDADHFFSQGWASTELSPEVAEQALALVKQQPFREESKRALSNPSIPSWDSDSSKKTSDNTPPTEIVSLWDTILAQPYFDYWRLIYGEFSQKTILLHQHRKGVKLPFHNDVHEGLHVTNCLFLTDTEWSAEFGGNLRFGHWRLDRRWWGDEGSVVQTAEVIARHGTLVSICNVIPTFCHSVSESVSPFTRYSLISRCGYLENVQGNKLSVLF